MEGAREGGGREGGGREGREGGREGGSEGGGGGGREGGAWNGCIIGNPSKSSYPASKPCFLLSVYPVQWTCFLSL